MNRVIRICLFVLTVFVLSVPTVRAESLSDSIAKGYHMTIPDGWAEMNRAQIKALNDYMSQFLSREVRGTELEVVSGYKPVGRDLVYPFIIVSADRSGKLAAGNFDDFNRRAVENLGALLNSRVYHPVGTADDITASSFDRDNWTFTVTAEPGGMLFRVHYVYTSTGAYVFRAFFDQRSMRLLPTVDKSFRSIALHERLRYAPENGEPDPASSSSRNIWIIYGMALLVLVGVWLTDFPSDEGGQSL